MSLDSIFRPENYPSDLVRSNPKDGTVRIIVALYYSTPKSVCMHLVYGPSYSIGRDIHNNMPMIVTVFQIDPTSIQRFYRLYRITLLAKLTVEYVAVSTQYFRFFFKSSVFRFLGSLFDQWASTPSIVHCLPLS